MEATAAAVIGGRAPPPRMLYCTPTHQYPLGGIIPVSERLGLLEWARSNQVWIIEDDYDSEYRYAGRPLPAMMSSDRDGRTLYIGSFSKVFSDGFDCFLCGALAKDGLSEITWKCVNREKDDDGNDEKRNEAKGESLRDNS